MTDTTDDLATHIARLVDINDRIAHLEQERSATKAAIAAAGAGEYAAHGVTVTVRPPARRFNLDRAVTMLAPEQLAVCQSVDAKKVRAQLPGTLLDACMDEGTGNLIVSVK